MRVETKQVTYYTLAELKEHHPNGYERAMDALRSILWEDSQRESVSDDIAYEFARRVGEPTVDRYGEGDYPGVPGVGLKGWDLERGSYVAFAGTLEREHCPGLPWDETGWLDVVRLTAGQHGTGIEVVSSEEDDVPYIGWHERTFTEDQQRLFDMRQAMADAVQDALSEALASGQRAAEAMSGEEYLLETAEANEWEFDAHGVMA
jgi:hypothetical protein